MSRSLSYLRRGLLGIAFVGSLGFGATQALATPPGAETARTCNYLACRDWCRSQGADSGECHPEMTGSCWCIWY